MAEMLKPGDVVRLKSGSPLMTVHKVYPKDDGEMLVRLVWMVEGKIQFADLDSRTLGATACQPSSEFVKTLGG